MQTSQILNIVNVWHLTVGSNPPNTHCSHANHSLSDLMIQEEEEEEEGKKKKKKKKKKST